MIITDANVGFAAILGYLSNVSKKLPFPSSYYKSTFKVPSFVPYRPSSSASCRCCINKRNVHCNTRCFKVKWNRGSASEQNIESTVRRCI